MLQLKIKHLSLRYAHTRMHACMCECIYTDGLSGEKVKIDDKGEAIFLHTTCPTVQRTVRLLVVRRPSSSE